MFEGLRKQIFPKTDAPVLPAVAENLVQVGGTLSTPELLRAYGNGCFPWTVNPVTWWSPDPRAIIDLTSFKAPRSMLKLLRKGLFEFTLDGAFERVIEGCAEPAPNRRSTWITPEFCEAYKGLHRAGHAHSVEVWQQGELVGGIYGVSIGGYFAGESMFHRVSNASKAALCRLIDHLRERKFELFDVQMPTRITVQLGAVVIPRTEFLARLRRAQSLPVRFGA